ncbi:MAG: hypothetical protein WAZ27_01475 [Minisyncoccia bacterium]
MIELVVVVCMIDQPSRCKDVTLTFESETVTSQQCEMYGQMEMAKWIGENPNWGIRKWNCQPAGQVAKI